MDWPTCKDEFPVVFDRDSNDWVDNQCLGVTKSGPGGGIVCPECGEWFCW